MKVLIIPYQGKLFQETRKAYFLRAFGEEVKEMRIIPFGKCNYACLYCKRNGYDKQHNIIKGSIEVEEEEIFHAVHDAIMNNQIVRLSGGDPCTYPELSIKILEYVKQLGGIGSMAHNGSSPTFIQYLVDHHLLDSLSVDLKAENSEKLKEIAGISEEMAHSMWNKTINTLQVLKNVEDIKLDIRTCVFYHTDYQELLNIGNLIKENSNPNVFWTLRVYSIVNRFSRKTKTVESMRELAKKLSLELPGLKIGVRVKWDNGAFFYFLNGEELRQNEQ